MIPLLVLALLLGTGLAIYEVSPKARTWIDAHVRSTSAHQTADAHLVQAKDALVRGEIWDALQHFSAALGANQEAAAHTATAAQTAQTAAERVMAATSAATVEQRQAQITADLAGLGVGQCGVRTYAGVTPEIQDALRQRLVQAGMTVTGQNPWDIDTQTMGVKLRAVWDPAGQLLKVIVTSGQGGLFGLVSCAAIWDKIDPIMKDLGL